MTFLIRIAVELEDGTVIHDETVLADTIPFYGFEKGMSSDGVDATLKVEFDPPLAPLTKVLDA